MLVSKNLVGHLSNKKTPQSSSVPGKNQILNTAGGYVFELDKWSRLNRFLIIGSDGGTYYISEKKLTIDNAKVVMACVRDDYKLTVDAIVEVSDKGSAPKNDYAILALALVASSILSDGKPNVEARSYALSKLSAVCRIPTHLFQFCEAVNELRGWGSGLRKAIARWYLTKAPDQLAYHVAKYKQREGWSHLDVLRLSHVGSIDVGLPITKAHDAIFRYIQSGDLASFGQRDVKRISSKTEEAIVWQYPAYKKDIPAIIRGMVELHEEVDTAKKFTKSLEKLVVNAISEYKLTHEMLPTSAKKSPAVWEALLETMPLTAMIRNLGNMSASGLLIPLSAATKLVKSKLADQEYIRKSRVHPITILTALRTYENGKGFKGSQTWTTVPAVVSALDGAFYLAFGNITPTNKNILYALDVSGSMSSRFGQGVLKSSEITAALSMALARVESNYHIMGFASDFRELGVTSTMSLSQALQKVSNLTFGGTDCALPAIWAKSNKVKNIDAIVIMTDDETWSGNIHPFQSLKAYRSYSGLPTRQVVLGTTATEFTIADPSDPLSMDIAGFNSSVPNVINEFIRGSF